MNATPLFQKYLFAKQKQIKKKSKHHQFWVCLPACFKFISLFQTQIKRECVATKVLTSPVYNNLIIADFKFVSSPSQKKKLKKNCIFHSEYIIFNQARHCSFEYENIILISLTSSLYFFCL